MKGAVVLSCMCIMLASALTPAWCDAKFVVTSTDQPFDSYGDISWEDEMAHLDNFAIALQHDPDSIGYIIVYVGRRACVGKQRIALSERRSTWYRLGAFRRAESNGSMGDIERN